LTQKSILVFIIFLLTISCSNQLKIISLEEDIAYGNHILQTQSNEILIAGRDQKNIYASRGWISEGNGILIKVDKHNNIIWKKKYDFLENSAVYDIIETANNDFIILSPNRTHYNGGRNTEQKPYSLFYTKISNTGEVIHQKILKGYQFSKIVSSTKNENIVIAINKNRLIISHLNIDGEITFENSLNITAHSIEEVYIENNTLFITVLEDKNNNGSEVKVVAYNINQKTHSHTSFISDNDRMFLNKSNVSAQFIPIAENTTKWQLELKDHNTGKRIVHNIHLAPDFTLIPRLKLNQLHICRQLGDSKQNIKQIVTTEKGDIFITATVIDPYQLENKNDKRVSNSTEAFCDNNSNGFILLKLDTDLNLKWIKHINKQVIPLHISSISSNIIAITGIYNSARYKNNEASNDKLFYLILNKDGNGI